MSDRSDRESEKLEAMLRARRFVPASPDLADRIILAARSIRPVAAPSLGQWVQQLFAEYRLPQPAYVMAGTLLVGFLVGLSAPLVIAPADDTLDTEYVQSFLYGEEDPS
jgi:hypothetical protein